MAGRVETLRAIRWWRWLQLVLAVCFVAYGVHGLFEGCTLGWLAVGIGVLWLAMGVFAEWARAVLRREGADTGTEKIGRARSVSAGALLITCGVAVFALCVAFYLGARTPWFAFPLALPGVAMVVGGIIAIRRV